MRASRDRLLLLVAYLGAALVVVAALYGVRLLLHWLIR